MKNGERIEKDVPMVCSLTVGEYVTPKEAIENLFTKIEQMEDSA